MKNKLLSVIGDIWQTSLILAFALSIRVSSFAQTDACSPVGWVNYNNSTYTGLPTGGSNSPITVTTVTDLVAAAKVSGNVIYVSGTMGSGYHNSAENVSGQGRVNVASNVTIIGLSGATVKAFFNIKNVSNVIIRNLIIQGPGAQDINSWDNITVDNSHNIWVDHCDIRDGEDSNFDIKNGSNNVSVTWCIFQYTAVTLAVGALNHNFSNTIGTSDSDTQDDGKLKVTFQYCWWNAAVERTPRVRYGEVHVANCLFTEAPTTTNTGGSTTGLPVSKLGVSDGYNSDVRVENCNFIGINDPLDRGKETTTTPSTSVLNSINNLFTSCSGTSFSGCQGVGTCPGFTPPYTLTLAANTAMNTTQFKNCVGATLTPVSGEAITCPCSSSLPVELISFDIKPYYDTYQLGWELTKTETLTKTIIEYSKDGISFNAIDSLLNSASFFNLPSSVFQENNTLYFRLKLIEIDGRTSYSPIRTITNKDLYKVYPNPFINEIKIAGIQQGSIEIYTIEGVKIYETIITPETINLAPLAKGTYYIIINDELKNEIKRLPLIKL